MSLLDSGPVVLDSPETMFAVLRELAGPEATLWRGAVDVWGEENPPGPAKWRLEVNDNRGNIVSAVEGDSLVYTYGHLLVINPAEVGS